MPVPAGVVELIQHTCLIYDVQPIPPDRVENVTMTEVVPRNVSSRRNPDKIGLVSIKIWYTWSAPRFVGEGITGYEIEVRRTDEGYQQEQRHPIELINVVHVTIKNLDTSNLNQFTFSFRVS